MRGKPLTLYVPDRDTAVIQRAKKLLAYHEEQSLSSFVVEKLKEVVRKHDAGRK